MNCGITRSRKTTLINLCKTTNVSVTIRALSKTDNVYLNTLSLISFQHLIISITAITRLYNNLRLNACLNCRRFVAFNLIECIIFSTKERKIPKIKDALKVIFL